MKRFKKGGIILAPGNTSMSTWLSGCDDVHTANVSGWMAVRGPRRRQSTGAGFALSDHADWPGLIEAIGSTGAQRIGITHGFIKPVVRYLRERGLDAFPVEAGAGEGSPEEMPETVGQRRSTDPNEMEYLNSEAT
jgi:putative mRNA 3-end processing factor